MSREKLECRRIDSSINNEYRFDNCQMLLLHLLNLKNCKLFYKLRRDNFDIYLTALELDANIICDF